MQEQNKNLNCADIFSEKRVLIVGLGKTGLSCARFLAERNITFAIMDSRLQPPGLNEVKKQFPGIDIHLGQFDDKYISQSEVLIVSPGVSVKQAAIQKAITDGKEIIGDVEVFARCTTRPVVAITGSNGKSTVTTLVGEMAKLANKTCVVAGNIGLPVLDAIERDAQAELYVLELSSFQMETTFNLNAAVSTVLNISEDHMDRYASLAEYTNAKTRISSGTGIVVINKDDEYLNSMLPDLSARDCLYFTLAEPRDDYTFGLTTVNGEQWLAQGKQNLLPVSELKISGRHNIANALASLALGTAVNLPMPAMLAALQRFTGLAHRTQWVTEHNGVNWFNDSKATNVGAAIAAIEGMQNPDQIVLLGGQGKGQDFSPLNNVLKQNSKAVLIYGEDAALIDAALKDITTKFVLDTFESVINKANEIAEHGDIVLLSPACASFDMFKGYEDRGDTFISYVKEITS